MGGASLNPNEGTVSISRYSNFPQSLYNNVRKALSETGIPRHIWYSNVAKGTMSPFASMSISNSRDSFWLNLMGYSLKKRL